MDLEKCDNKVWFINCPFCNLNQNKGDLFYSKRKKKIPGVVGLGTAVVVCVNTGGIKGKTFHCKS